MINNTGKKLVTLTGKVMSLKTGERAFIRSSEYYIRTSTVVAIMPSQDNNTLFETRNSLYCVTAPDPASAETNIAHPLCA